MIESPRKTGGDALNRMLATLVYRKGHPMQSTQIPIARKHSRLEMYHLADDSSIPEM